MKALGVIAGIVLVAVSGWSLMIPHNHEFDWMLLLLIVLGGVCSLASISRR